MPGDEVAEIADTGYFDGSSAPIEMREKDEPTVTGRLAKVD